MMKSFVITNFLGLTACAFVVWGLYSWVRVGIALGSSLSVPIGTAGVLSVALSCLEYDAKNLQAYPKGKLKTQSIKEAAKS